MSIGAAGELLRGATTLGYFFGASPVVGLAIRTRARDREQARALAVAHLRRTRELGGIRFTVEGESHVPRGRGCVIVYNETSLADLFVTSEVLWRFTDQNVIAAEFARVPLMSATAERAGLTFMPRGDRAATDRVLATLAVSVSQGACVSFAAQGGVARAPGVAHFKRGAFLVAIRAAVPVVPMAVRGGREILPPYSLRMRPGVIRCRYGPPLTTAGLQDDDAPALAERTRRIVEAMFSAA